MEDNLLIAANKVTERIKSVYFISLFQLIYLEAQTI